MGVPSKHKIYTEAYQQQATDYKQHLDILGLSPQTTQMRYLYLKEFYNWLEQHTIFEIKEVTPKIIAQYNHYLQNKISQRTAKPLQQQSVYGHMRNLQQYFGYLQETGQLTTNPASHLKFNNTKHSPKRITFTQSQIRELYNVGNEQERVILHIAYGCGLRVKEISQLNWEDVRLSENLLIVEKGKNSKRRLVPLSDVISNDLKLFLASQREDSQKAVFCNSKDNRMQPWTFNALLKNLIRKTAFGKEIPPEALCKMGMHTLRHSIATHLLENGMKLEQVQYFLGHSHIESTAIYTHISQNQLNELMQ